MQSCPTLNQLEEALAGKLEAPQCDDIEAHVEGCSMCQRLLEESIGEAPSNPYSLEKSALIQPARLNEVLDPAFRRRLEQELPNIVPKYRGDAKPRVQPSPVIEGYEIIEKLGHGGMGVVYMAWHFELKRVVALKMVLAGAHADPEIVARFRNEIEAVARLQHPHIVQIYETGEKDGLPYCTLEYVEGGNLAQKLKGTPLPPSQVAPLVATLAHAMQYAHGRGIIHRDLNPSNVMLTSEGSPKITDFGLAKMLFGGDSRTRTGDVMGTPSYMSPEQALGRTHDVSAATDIYTLGVILYEMLTGRAPFLASSPVDTIRQVVSDDPVPPSRLQPGLPRDLETICLKCLEKEPQKRYASALALAQDLESWMEGGTIQARRSSITERVVKWTRRRPAIAALLALLGIVAFSGLGGILWQLDRAESAGRQSREYADAEKKMRLEAEKAKRAESVERIHAVAARDQAEETLYSNRIALASQMCIANNIQLAEQLLDRCRFDERGWEWNYLKRICHTDERTIRDGSGLLCVACSSDGTLMAAGGWMKTVRVWRLEDNHELFSLSGHRREIQGLAFRPGRQQLASGSADQTITIWDCALGRAVTSWQAHSGEIRGLAYSPDGRLLASVGDDGLVNVWDAETAVRQASFDGKAGPALAVAFSPDGELLAVAHMDTVAIIWNLKSGTRVWTLKGHQSPVLSVAFMPDGSQLISSSFDCSTRFWDLTTGKQTRCLTGHRNGVQGFAVSRDGLSLATASWDRTIQIWDLAAQEGTPVSVKGHAEAVMGVLFHPSRQSLISISSDRSIKIWPLPPQQGCKVLNGHLRPVDMVRYSPDGKTLASASWDLLVKIWDADTGDCRLTLEGHAAAVNCLAYSPDSKYLVSGSADHAVKRWDLSDGRPLLDFTGHTGPVSSVAFSPDGKSVASASGKTVLVWNPADASVRYECQHPNAFSDVSFSSDGRYLAAAGGIAGQFCEITLFDAATGKVIRTLKGHENSLRRGQFSHNGQQLVSAGFDHKVIVWDVESGRLTKVLKGHNDWIYDVAISPSGDRVASTSVDGTIKLWDPSRGRETLTIEGPWERSRSVAFSPDGNHLAAGNEDGNVRIWDATACNEEVPAGRVLDVGPAGPAGVIFSPDGRSVAGAREDGRIQLWDAATGWETTSLPGHESIVTSLIFSPDGSSLASSDGNASEPGEVKIWDLEAGKLRTRLRNDKVDTRVLAFLPSGKGIATLNADGINLWDESTEQPDQRLRPAASKQFTIGAASPDGNIFVAADDQRAVHVWDVANHRDQTLASPNRTLSPHKKLNTEHTGALIAIVFDSAGQRLLTADNFGSVRIWDTVSWREQDNLKMTGPIRCFALAPDDHTIACGDILGIVQTWDLRSKQVVQTRYGYCWEAADQVRFSPNGKTLAIACKKGSITLWNSQLH